MNFLVTYFMQKRVVHLRAGNVVFCQHFLGCLRFLSMIGFSEAALLRVFM